MESLIVLLQSIFARKILATDVTSKQFDPRMCDNMPVQPLFPRQIEIEELLAYNASMFNIQPSQEFSSASRLRSLKYHHLL